MRVGGDHRPDVLEREPDCACLERRQARRGAERVAPKLLVDVHRAVAQLGVHRVTAAAEVDEVEKGQVLLELVRRDRREVLEQLRLRDLGVPLLAARRQEIGEQRLEDGEPLGRHGPSWALSASICRRRGLLARRLRGLALVLLAHAPQRCGDVPLQLGRLERHGPAVLAQHPRRELGNGGVVGDEDAVLEPAGRAVGAPHPPGRVAQHLDPRSADDVADLPRRPAAVELDVEVRRRAEVPFPPRGELDVPANPGDAEGADLVPVEIVADDVPHAVVGKQRVRVQRPLGLDVPRDRPVVELDGALLRDRAFELREASGHLRRVIGVEHLDAVRGRGGRLGEPGAAEREVLQREPQRLGVGELSFEQVQRGVERGELVVLELELRQEVLLGAKRVQLLAGELVALRLQRHAEREQLGPVGVEATGERLVRHLGIALDVRLHVARGDRPPLRHEERDQRELTDQLVGVM